MEILLTGERIDADRAKELGIAGWVVPHDRLLLEANALADRLLQGAPLAQRAIKEVAMRSEHLSTIEAIRFGETMRKVAGATEDAARRVQACPRPPLPDLARPIAASACPCAFVAQDGRNSSGHGRFSIEWGV